MVVVFQRAFFPSSSLTYVRLGMLLWDTRDQPSVDSVENNCYKW